MNDCEVLIVGAGITGATLALALADAGVAVTVLDREAPPPLPAPGQPLDVRVSAIHAAAAGLLERLGAWQRLPAACRAPFGRIEVWDAGSLGSIRFDSAQIGQPWLGWIAENRAVVAALHARLAQLPAARVLAPAVLEDWLGPFSDLVRNYGIPRYGEFDPTWLFAISFVLMFGMMFGDIGQGLVIAAGSFALRGKARRFRPLFIGAGLSATAFGFAYGSLFGFETIVEPLWVSPLHDPVRMLLAAVWWGVGFITVTQLLTIYNRMASGMVSRALFDAGGVAGLFLYLGAAAGVYGLATAGQFGVIAAIVSGAGLAAILVWNWIENHGGVAERLLTVIIETFESVIGFFSNTLSFMRVAAFSINHVALALAVFTIADSLGATGRWIALVIGNIIILGLEGAIVAIQVLRLEYYEGFSRFYSGSGRAFQPLVLRKQQHLKT